MIGNVFVQPEGLHRPFLHTKQKAYFPQCPTPGFYHVKRNGLRVTVFSQNEQPKRI